MEILLYIFFFFFRKNRKNILVISGTYLFENRVVMWENVIYEEETGQTCGANRTR